MSRAWQSPCVLNGPLGKCLTYFESLVYMYESCVLRLGLVLLRLSKEFHIELHDSMYCSVYSNTLEYTIFFDISELKILTQAYLHVRGLSYNIFQ